MLIGTNTSDKDTNFVQIATVHLPKSQAELNIEKYDDERGGKILSFAAFRDDGADSDSGENDTEIGTHTATEPRVQIIQSICHRGEVNRARYMPQNPDLIATKTMDGSVLIFDRTKHPSKPVKDGCRPEITLNGHTKEG